MLLGPLFLLEAPLSLTLRAYQRARPALGPRLARALPFLHHDVINAPLPGLRGFLIDLAPHDPALTARLIALAAESLGQQRPARQALLELQARSIEQAARDVDWRRVEALDLPFMPALDDLPPTDAFRRYADAAANLGAAGLGGDQRRRARLLREARDMVAGQQLARLGAAQAPDPRTARLVAVDRVWQAAIDGAIETLGAEIAAEPEVPNVFVTGPALDPADPDAAALFRARRDVISIIDHDLADDRRAALLLLGQRRMGKTSLLKMLPAHLGRRARVIVLDFQGLSGSGHRMAPHRWVIDAIRDTIADGIPDGMPATPDDDTWGPALDWLIAIEPVLAKHELRVLVALDEVERVQTGVEEGWSTPAFLDFIRAAGDRLRRVRLLLVSAHPLTRLGPHWADRLISVEPRTLGPLPMDDAEDLLRRPVPDFPPEVFDAATAAAVLVETGGHPFLIQLVGDAVVARLNGDRRRVATARDIRRGLDAALDRAAEGLFPDLWRVLSAAEQGCVRRVAAGQAVGVDDKTARGLRRLGYLIERDDVAAFAFPLFGRWVRDFAE